MMITASEQEWFRKFYEGTFLIKGWKDRMEELLEKVPPDDREHIRGLLDNLGKKIGSEWAKDNKIRKIDSAMLKHWGNDLNTAGNEGPDALIEKIRLLDSKADNILA
jgi:hypothetical protein